MIRVTARNKMVLVGKAHEIVEAFDELCNKYELNTPFIQIIEEILKN